MSGWQERLAPWLRAIEKRYDALKYKLYYALGGPGPMRIVPYRGYGTAKTLRLRGRVLVDKDISPPGEDDSAWENAGNMLKRIHSREVTYARVRADFRDVTQVVEADEEGMFTVEVFPHSLPTVDTAWVSIDLELLSPQSSRQEEPVTATGEVRVPSSSARFGVISDIDDTVMQTEATSLLRMARNVLLSNARTRLAFEGVAAFYRALRAGASEEETNPLFYVSNSPWNFYDVLVEFFRLQEIPIGPILLRNWGITEDEILPTKQVAYKLDVIRPILEMYPDLPFILIGDSGETDPEIYHRLVHDYPGRILAIYIRSIDRDPARLKRIRALAEEVVAAQSTLVLAEDSRTMARHAARQGWIDTVRLQEL
jgi:phosphatidate phosphatase APP1